MSHDPRRPLSMTATTGWANRLRHSPGP